MIEIAPLRSVRCPASFIATLDIQPAQAEQMALTPENLAVLLTSGSVWAAYREGVPVAIAGLLEFWPGRVVAWAYIGRRAGPAMLKVTRMARRELARIHAVHAGQGRIELCVQDGHDAGGRWARQLGFFVESRMRRFYGGKDYYMYIYGD